MQASRRSLITSNDEACVGVGVVTVVVVVVDDDVASPLGLDVECVSHVNVRTPTSQRPAVKRRALFSGCRQRYQAIYVEVASSSS